MRLVFLLVICFWLCVDFMVVAVALLFVVGACICFVVRLCYRPLYFNLVVWVWLRCLVGIALCWRSLSLVWCLLVFGVDM